MSQQPLSCSYSTTSPVIAFLAFVILACSLLLPSSAIAQSADNHTLLLLHFNNSMVGEQGDQPAQADGVSYETGKLADSCYFAPGNLVFYSAPESINEKEGTLEFWLKPRWAGNDGQTHTILNWRGGGGLGFSKDGANNLRSIFNRYGEGGQPEVGVSINISDWQPNQWHHVAYTWSSASKILSLYVDGTLKAKASIPNSLPTINGDLIQLGGEGNTNSLSLNGVLDELRISDIPRTAEEIAQSYIAGLNIHSLAVSPSSLSLPQTWTYSPSLTADTDQGILPVPNTAATWASNNTSVATVESNGRITGIAADTANITATVNGVSAVLPVTVHAPVLPPQEDAIAPFLATPATGYQWQVPVAIIRYLPTQDGVNIDSDVADWNGTVNDLRSYTDRLNIETKFMLEEGSRFRGYKTPNALPSLGYKVVKIITVYEELPPDKNPAHGTGNPNAFFPDYNQILTRFGAQHLVQDLGVKEFWIWGYHHGNIVPVESDMSSPTTGDISNSFRFPDDLPIFDRTYTLYNYNFTRSSNESVHNHGHQLEAILGYVNQLQDNNDELFWNKFVGRTTQGGFTAGRCGWTHMPPNTTVEYDYANPNSVLSDIEDWTPANTGQKKQVSAATWANQTYAWPNGIPEDITQHQWYIYWMQNMPGRDNTIPYGTNTMTNWWTFTGDWDASASAVTTKWGLYRSPSLITLTHIEPGSVAAGSSEKTITLTGTGFIPASSVRFGTVALNTTYASATQLTAVIPTSELTSPRTVDVTVVNPMPNGGTSNPVTFSINSSAPILTGMTPDSAIAGSSELVITLTGSKFTGQSRVVFGTTELATTYVSPTSLKATIPAALLTTGTKIKVTVTTPAPGGGISSGLIFTINNTVPKLTSITPNHVNAGVDAITLTLAGSHFVPTSQARFGTAKLTTTYVSATQLTAVISKTLLATAGTVNVTVTSPEPVGGTSNPIPFSIINPIPTLIRITPSSVTVGATETTLIVTGTNFVLASQVKLGTTVLNTTFVSSTRLTATVPTHLMATVGAYTVKVTSPTPGGGTSNGLTFTVGQPVPVVSTVSPNSAAVYGSAVTITVTGNGFTPSSRIRFGDTVLTTTYVSATSLQGTIPTNLMATGGIVNITVTTPSPGGGTSNIVKFTLNNPIPTLTKLSPSSLPVGSPETTVTLTGTNFVRTSQVKFGTKLLTTTFSSSKTMTVVVPANLLTAATNYSVTVTNPTPSGGKSSALIFSVH